MTPMAALSRSAFSLMMVVFAAHFGDDGANVASGGGEVA
jgi:hypothetical protein